MEPWEVVAVQILQKENLSSAILEQNKANTACYEGRLQSLISAFGSYWLLFLGGEFSHIWEVNWYTRKSYAVKFFYFFPILRSYLISINRLRKDFSRVFSLQELKGFPKNNVQWLQLQCRCLENETRHENLTKCPLFKRIHTAQNVISSHSVYTWCFFCIFNLTQQSLNLRQCVPRFI